MRSTPTEPAQETGLLTIIIPTYNRADSLEPLVGTLRVELDGLDHLVTVLVSDNASTDRTHEVLATAQAGWPSLVVQSHSQNLGPENNFCSGLDRVESRYFWILGDDDLPKRGVIAKLIALLRERAPALVYMESEWVNPILGPDQGQPVGALQISMLSAVEFARRVHVWTTFISGMIIDRSLLMNGCGAPDIRRFNATSLVQLGWVLPLLCLEKSYAVVSDRCVLATKDNTGGYPLMTVFGARYPHIVREVFGHHSDVGDVLIDGCLLHYLPGLLWNARGAITTRHSAEDAFPAMRSELGDRVMFWLLIAPLCKFPRWLAQPFFQSWRVLCRLRREIFSVRIRITLPGRQP